MIENLQDELSQLENKQAKTVKLYANIRWVKKMLQNFFSCPFRCLWKLYTMGFTSRKGIKSVIYKKCDKRDIENYRPISFLNLDYKIYTTLLRIESQNIRYNNR